MAFVPGFKNDLFISYAHDDDLPDTLQHRWISSFKRDLETALLQRLGQPVEIFFDTRMLDPHHHLDFLLDNARHSAIFLPRPLTPVLRALLDAPGTGRVLLFLSCGRDRPDHGG
jgi:hypothetical protein